MSEEPPAEHPHFGPGEEHSLVDLVNRVLDRGVVLHGDVTISVAGVDLVFLGLNALLTSISTARRAADRRPLPPAPGERFDPPPPAPAPASLAEAVGSLHRPPSRPAPSTPAREAATTRPEIPDALAARLVEVAEAMPSRIDVDPDGVQRDLGRLVLTVVELLRQVVEHQAVRRMEDGDLGEEQIERMGEALLRLEEKMKEIKKVFGVADHELNLDLGPLGKLL